MPRLPEPPSAHRLSAYAEKEIERPGGLGLMGYAKAVAIMDGNYSNVFKESKASWNKTQKGFDLLCTSYPTSKYILNDYFRLATLAEDWPRANKLLIEIGDDVVPDNWGGIDNFNKMRDWLKARK